MLSPPLTETSNSKTDTDTRELSLTTMHQPMFPANGSVLLNGTPNGAPKAFSDDTKILGYDPVIMPALIYAELPLVFNHSLLEGS